MRKYLVIFIVVFLVLDLVLLIGFFGRKSTPTPATPQTTQTKKPVTTPGTQKGNTQTSSTATKFPLPLRVEHPNVKGAQVLYTFDSQVKSVTSSELTLTSKGTPIPPLKFAKDTKVFRLNGGQISNAEISNLASNQNVEVVAKYYMRTRKWEVQRVTIK